MNIENNKIQTESLIFNILADFSSITIYRSHILNNIEYKKLEIEQNTLFLAIKKFCSYKLIDITPNTTNPNIPETISFTLEGVRVKELPSKYLDFIEELNKKISDKKIKEQRDEEIKDKQLEELRVKVKHVENQYKEQSKYWKSGLQKDNYQYLHWLFTIVLAIISVYNGCSKH